MARCRLILATAVLAVAALGGASAALAQSCQEDIGKLVARRQAVLEVINRSVKAGHGKLDPVSSCPRLRNLVAIENEFVAYLNKNKDWCHVPDEAVTNATNSRAKMASTASRACNFASQAQRARRQQQQQQQAAGAQQQAPAQRLPSGPL